MFLALFCAAIVCVPLLIVSFLYDAIPYDLGRVQRDLQSAYSLRAKQVCIRQRGRLKPGDDHHCGSPALCCLVSPRGKRLPHSRLVRTLRLSLLLFSPSFLSGKRKQPTPHCRKRIPQRLGLANVLHKTDGSHTNRPFFRAVQSARVGSALLSKRPPRPQCLLFLFFRGKTPPKQAAPHPLFRMRRAALCFVFYLPMLR